MPTIERNTVNVYVKSKLSSVSFYANPDGDVKV